MGKAQELLEKLKRRREEAEAVCAYWAEVLPNLGRVPEAHLQSWLGTYDFDTIVAGVDGAVIQRSKRFAKGDPMDAEQAVRYASAVMRDLRYKAMPEEERKVLEERKARIHEVRSAAGKAGRAKQLQQGAQACREFAQVCQDLPDVAQPLPNTYTGSSSGSGSSSLSSSHTHTAASASQAKPAAAAPPVSHPLGKAEEKTQTNTNPVGALGLSKTANQDNTKTEKPKGKPCPKCDGMLYRDKNHVCSYGCTVCELTITKNPDRVCNDCRKEEKAKAVRAASTLSTYDPDFESRIKANIARYGNELGVDEL